MAAALERAGATGAAAVVAREAAPAGPEAGPPEAAAGVKGKAEGREEADEGLPGKEWEGRGEGANARQVGAAARALGPGHWATRGTRALVTASAAVPFRGGAQGRAQATLTRREGGSPGNGSQRGSLRRGLAGHGHIGCSSGSSTTGRRRRGAAARLLGAGAAPRTPPLAY